MVQPAVAAALHALAERQETAAAPTRELTGGARTDYLEQRALEKGMCAVMKGERSSIGRHDDRQPVGACGPLRP